MKKRKEKKKEIEDHGDMVTNIWNIKKA